MFGKSSGCLTSRGIFSQICEYPPNKESVLNKQESRRRVQARFKLNSFLSRLNKLRSENNGMKNEFIALRPSAWT